jgi:hypothetical protein
MVFITILIIFFIILLGNQLILASTNSYSLIEGMDNNPSSTQYSPYNTNDPNNVLILAQQNAGNIQYLKGRMDDVSSMKSDITSLQEQVKTLNTQMQGLVKQQASFAQNMAGSTPPTITGTNPTPLPSS